nr:unnamed protein product [Callosobruchus chinensis]
MLVTVVMWRQQKVFWLTHFLLEMQEQHFIRVFTKKQFQK